MWALELSEIFYPNDNIHKRKKTWNFKGDMEFWKEAFIFSNILAFFLVLTIIIYELNAPHRKHMEVLYINIFKYFIIIKIF